LIDKNTELAINSDMMLPIPNPVGILWSIPSFMY